MYSEKLKAKQVLTTGATQEEKRRTLGEITKEQIYNMILGFCEKDDIHGVMQKDVYDLFDEYCDENKYPKINHKTLGNAFSELWGVSSVVKRINSKIVRIYICDGSAPKRRQ